MIPRRTDTHEDFPTVGYPRPSYTGEVWLNFYGPSWCYSWGPFLTWDEAWQARLRLANSAMAFTEDYATGEVVQ